MDIAICSVTGFLMFTTILSGIVLSSSTTHADNSSTDSVSVTVGAACTLSATGGGSYSASINPGNTSVITGSKLSTICNDPNGYSIYAIGYSGDSYDTPTNTQMIGAGGIGNIVTGTAKSGNTSNWAMQVTPTTGTDPTIMNGFDSADFHVVPDTYTQVAKYTASTASASATGASIDTKYQAYIAAAQAAGSYTGKVKYTMVHPNTAPAPSTVTTFDQAFADAGKTKQGNYYKMQDATASICEVVTEGQVGQLIDSRDNQVYYVGKLKDGKCWMLENLKLGRTLTEGQALTLTAIDSNTNGNYTLQYSDIPTDGKFHAHTINGIPNQNNSNEWICRTDWDSCYYNWYTATAGAGTTATTSGSVDTSICPAGWSLPIGDLDNQFEALYNQYPSAAQMEVDNPTTTKNNSAGKIPGFLLSGGYDSTGARSIGSGGYYWTRSAYFSYARSAQRAHYLYMTTSDVYPVRDNGKYLGFAVRCIAQ